MSNTQIVSETDPTVAYYCADGQWRSNGAIVTYIPDGAMHVIDRRDGTAPIRARIFAQDRAVGMHPMRFFFRDCATGEQLSLTTAEVHAYATA